MEQMVETGSRRTRRRLETISVVEALENDLEQRVLQGDFQPGEHLHEVELAKEYHVGRHTLRAAFDCLVRRGLLEKTPNRGVFVRILTERDLLEIYELRTALEVAAFRELASRHQVPAEAAAAVRRVSELTSESPQRMVVDADLGFHRALVTATGNRRLTRAHEDLGSELRLLIAQLVNRYADAREIGKQHAELLETIGRGDPAAAEAAIRAHLAPARSWLAEHGTTRPD